MAKRPIFKVSNKKDLFIEEVEIDFEFHNGLSVSQKQKSIRSLHQSAKDSGIENILEISTKSESQLGNMLSAFNLTFFNIENKLVTLEGAFQGSKIFENDGPFNDLYFKTPSEIKKDERISRDKIIIGFKFDGVEWPIVPKTAFYDWLYLKALQFNKENSGNSIYEEVLNYGAFTDIEFNPKKSINCQARSCALYVSLARKELLDIALESKEAFLDILSKDSFYNVEHKEELSQEKFNLDI